MNPATATEFIDIGSDNCTAAAEAWEQICEALCRHHHLFLFTDFDGTLSDIVPLPSAAVVDVRTNKALKRLYRERNVTIAVLSGRSVSDVADRVGLPLIYGGDHGLEIHGSDFEFVVPAASELRLEIPALCNEIRRKTQDIPGALVEAKRFTASVHYRQVASDRVSEVLEICRQTVDSSRFELRDGHCVVDIRPRVNWGKGDAVQWILDRSHASPEQAICIGDDETDEDMFRRVPNAVNIRITDPRVSNSGARYCLSRHEVPAFLEGLIDVIQGVCTSSQYPT